VTETISVVIPAYDGSAYLSEAIESILAQTAPPGEIIVVDDGSSDGTIEPASRYPVRVLRTPHRGIGPARNRGVGASSGELIAFLDSDDLWTPRKLELQTAALAAEAADIVFGHQEEFVSPEAPPAPLPPRARQLRKSRADPPARLRARGAVHRSLGAGRVDRLVGQGA